MRNVTIQYNTTIFILFEKSEQGCYVKDEYKLGLKLYSFQ